MMTRPLFTLYLTCGHQVASLPRRACRLHRRRVRL